ncbi:MAG: cytochrome c biogenesis protein CcsA [Gammaproteobacteria bacterium]|nr:MAG: cytochrome c biogenesis protein CcsA [Gammaproteobacteria bacterium]
MYLVAGVALAATRLPRCSSYAKPLLLVAVALAVVTGTWHARTLWQAMAEGDGLYLSIGSTVSVVGLQLALIALLGSLDASLRGLAGGLLILGAFAAAALDPSAPLTGAAVVTSWQIEAHILISLFAYSLLSTGAIVAIYALIQDQRLRAARIAPVNQLFAPLETTERLLFGITAAGFALLLLAIFSGFVFVENLFAQHLVHKTALSLLALILFGVLIAGRQFAGWRGKRAIYLYLWGFAILCLAYFGSRYVLENVLGRSWS